MVLCVAWVDGRAIANLPENETHLTQNRPYTVQTPRSPSDAGSLSDGTPRDVSILQEKYKNRPLSRIFFTTLLAQCVQVVAACPLPGK